MADDLVLLINEVLKPFSQIEAHHSWVLLFRIGLLEFSLEQSPYNFDIQLQLMRIYDDLGCSGSFNSSIQYFGLKGVQLESMGYLVMRHCLDWGEVEMLEGNFN